ncbi:protein-L-isoaspartate(D-aspartate) O-methyltransferase [Variovorax guangxiensis]|uniref:protein-L-isoaspartate(D-aspartate) O-methyltransferase n=1 Tax=Variovorax guangxiensis TaxID=1775474 RepID=UPI002859C053|nr:protein-L-isoaspartate(D-aspartate) O-methyltransferase [Variovorax guangxiensis]MDR6860008.1 protein-L-isoaspartate(D-aspartate) O-methyltransferase [Variovorax guangxiensis]
MPATALRLAATALLLLAALDAAHAAASDDRADERQRLTQTVAAQMRETGSATGRPALSERVTTALRQVPRHAFVPEDQRLYAYVNRPLPIGHGQTISQPYIVALMTELAQPQPDHKVLEVGTGSGYQAAVMARLVRTVYSMEIIEPLGLAARERLQTLGYRNVEVRLGDGYHGWEEHAPYDAILVTAAASHIPPPLIRQLKPGGRMVIPVGAAFLVQQLMLVEKNADGTVSTRQILPVAFVPLTGGAR